ncbi:amino acid ABC transporter permease [Amylibacter ulvae]|uniref:Amino acid ABC transporter permease n=1 Tax=Paramylibacter ulvae TaxID=1651968 RepID=A0ABQ3CTY5_9RHOB|nr:amino acid ABC transporter permease [Amylibacter ulvae]GHA42763.1 amino acid ABC transporter permease [Amylibacter ulvae]
MTCGEAISAYLFRAIGVGERLLPSNDIGICEQVILIGSGVMWNIYFALFAVIFGFFAATALALGKFDGGKYTQKFCAFFIYFFRGTPLFIQFFFAYELFVLLPRLSIDIPLGFTTITAETRWFTRAWLGAAIVLFLNTAAYSAEIFYGALRAIPRGEVEAGAALGLSRWQRFRLIIWPTMLRLAWPSYTNEAIFLFHATTLVYFSSFPAWQQKGDALYYANYFAEKTFNPFVAYPIVAAYFIAVTLCLIFLFGRVNKRLTRHIF